MFTLTQTPDADQRRSPSLFCEISGLAPRACYEAYGAANRDAYYEPERGYDGDEWLFTHEGGEVVALYSRWGVLRIAASPEVGPAFIAWLTERFSTLRAQPLHLPLYLATQLAHAAIHANQ